MQNDDSGSGKRRKRPPRRGERNPPPPGRKFTLSLPQPDPTLTQQHASEVLNVSAGQDIVETETLKRSPPSARRNKPVQGKFSEEGFVEIKRWLGQQPADAPAPTSPMIQYPRMWSTNRGRYCKFKAPGAGTYGLLRARATF